MAFKVNRERLIESFLRLCAIPGESKREGKVAEALVGWFEERGYKVERDLAHLQYGGEAANIAVRIPGSAPGPTVLLSAHMDTVVAGGQVVPLRENGWIRSSGETILGADDRAGIAAILEVVERLREEHLPHLPLLIGLTGAEEIGLLGARFSEWNGDDAQLGVVLDTSGPIGKIVYQAPFYEAFEIVVRGKSAHAGIEPEKGVNAIVAAAKLIAELPSGRLSPETTANVAQIGGGVAGNIVPERVTISGEVRSTVEAELLQVLEQMEESCRQLQESEGVRVEWSHLRDYDGFSLDRSSEVIERLSAAARAIGAEPIVSSTGGGSDANFFNQKGIPTAVISCGMSKVHTHFEEIAEEDLVDVARMVLALVTAPTV